MNEDQNKINNNLGATELADVRPLYIHGTEFESVLQGVKFFEFLAGDARVSRGLIQGEAGSLLELAFFSERYGETRGLVGETRQRFPQVTTCGGTALLRGGSTAENLAYNFIYNFLMPYVDDGTLLVEKDEELYMIHRVSMRDARVLFGSSYSATQAKLNKFDIFAVHFEKLDGYVKINKLFKYKQ